MIAHGEKAATLPWTSSRTAMRTELVDDLESYAALLACCTRAHDGTQGTRDPSLAADHLAAVGLGDVQAEDELVVLVHLVDAHGIRLVDELPRYVLEQLGDH